MEVLGVVLLVAVGIAFGLLVAYDYVTGLGWERDSDTPRFATYRSAEEWAALRDRKPE